MKMNSQIKSLGKQAGYTLIELSIAIAIISVLVMSALFGVQKILDNNNADTTAQQVTLATANISKYATMLHDKTFVGTINTAAPLGLWPDSVTKNNGTTAAPDWEVKDAFGGYYVLGSTAGGYFIGITNLSQNGCLSVASALSNAAIQIDTDETSYTTSKLAAAAAFPAAPTNVKPLGGKATGGSLATGCTPSAAGKKKTVWAQYSL